MPYHSTWVEPDLFLEHKGVKVYHTYKDQDYERQLTYQYAVGSEDDMFNEELHEFDVRDLHTFKCSPSDSSSACQAIKRAIEIGGIDLLVKTG